MSQEMLEQRVAALESQVAELRRQLGQSKPALSNSDEKWWERIGQDWSPEELEAFDRMVAYGHYFRATGKEAPPDWNPGDPIPELEFDE